MGLEDKFYPEDGTLLTRFDNAMIRAAGKIGELYQHLTGREGRELVRKSYVTSAALFAGSMASPNPFDMAIGGLMAHSIYTRRDRPMITPVKEQIALEAMGWNPKTGKALRGGMVGLTAVIVGMTAYAWSNIPASGEEGYALQVILRVSDTLWAAGITLSTFADYLACSQIPKPPEKTVWKRAKELFHVTLAPQPAYAPTNRSATEPF